MKQVTIYTDGACKGNPGPGGYGARLSYKGKFKEIGQGYRKTTNSRMELLAAIASLELLKEPCQVSIYSDSRYVVDSINKGWLDNWAEQNFRRRTNADLWRRLDKVRKIHVVDFWWVKGHSGEKGNERADMLANMALQGDLIDDEGYEV